MSFAIWRSSMVSRLMNDMRGNNETTGVGLRPTPVVFCSRFGGATRRPPRCGRPVGRRVGGDGRRRWWDAACNAVLVHARRGVGLLRGPVVHGLFDARRGLMRFTAWPRGTRAAAFPTQGCGPAALPLGYLGIHRFAVRRSAGPRDGRRV